MWRVVAVLERRKVSVKKKNDYNDDDNNHSNNKKILWDIEIQMDQLIVDFDVSVDHRVKLKEGEKRDKYLALARE